MDNNTQKISLNDDFSSLKNVIPISFYFNNQWYSLFNATKLGDLLINLSQKLYVIDSKKLKKLPKETATEINGTLHFKIAFDDKVLKEPFKIKDSTIFIDLDISPTELQTLIKQILKIYELDKTPFFIRVKNAPPKKIVSDKLYTKTNYYINSRFNKKSHSIDNWVGTPHHSTFLSKKENDPKRSKKRCIYYQKDNYCTYMFSKCNSSSHCASYKEYESP